MKFRKRHLYHISVKQDHPYSHGTGRWGTFDIHEIPEKWEIVVLFRSSMMKSSTSDLYNFDKIAENPVKGIPFSNFEYFILFDWDFENFDIREIPKTDLPLYVSFEKIYPSMTQLLKEFVSTTHG